MLLGGLRYLLPVIDAAHKLGLHVITCDYIPDNIAHQYSDEYHNVSITDKEAVLELARKLRIDGIMSFAVDPGVVTAAYVAEKMGLPFAGSYEAVQILQDKARFRDILTKYGFNVPHARDYDNVAAALADVDYFRWPVIVKPVDSAGSKGVSRVERSGDLPSAVCEAISESHSGRFIIEDFLEKDGDTSDSDCFSVNGRLVYMSYSSQLFDEQASNPYTPSSYAWPSSMPSRYQMELASEVQRLISILDLKSGIYNIETRICKDGNAYIMEVSPRGGGNRLAEMLRYATHTDLILNAVRVAVGEFVAEIETPVYDGYWAEVILHCDKNGHFKKLELDPAFEQKYVVEKDLWVAPGTKVEPFTGANHAIGTLVLHCSSYAEMEDKVRNYRKWLKVLVD